jgi:hypothetical protein
MTEPLRPLSVGEILDRAFSLYRHNFVLLVGVAVLGPFALLVARLSLALAGFGGGRAGMVEDPALAGTTIFVGIVFYLLGQAVSVAATTRAVAAVYLGRAITIGESFASIKARIPRVIGVMLATILIGGGGAVLILALGGMMVGFLSILGRFHPSRTTIIISGVLDAAVFIGCVIAAIAFAIRYALSVQACVVEDLKVRASLARSKVLTKNARKRLMTVMIVCSILVYAMSMLFGIVAALVPVGANPLTRQIVMQIFTCIAGALGAPLLTAAMSLVYYDERVRKEGFDLQLLMESLDTPVSAQPAEATPTVG